MIPSTTQFEFYGEGGGGAGGGGGVRGGRGGGGGAGAPAGGVFNRLRAAGSAVASGVRAGGNILRGRG